ncbi:MAG: type II CRISPR RNA-guided endonuclease Cas9, partial [Spirochaetales bacterium]|nr:type II CRISPR RNA-guided endonuclease Cas9 [Spirochaetales bacterium]
LRGEKYLGGIWDSLTLKEQDNFVECLIDSDSDEEIVVLMGKWDLTKEQIDNILNATFSSGTTNLSKEFMQDCIQYMEGEWLPYHKAVERLGFHHSDFNNREELLPRLPYYGEVLKGSTIGAKPNLFDKNDKPEQHYGKIGNPTVHIALNQLRKLVNALIDRFGSPSEIVVELSRDLKQSRDAKADIFKRQKEAKKENDRIRKEFEEEGIHHPSAWDIKKFKLWEELGGDSMVRRCVYCGETISRSQLATNEVEIEHILPYSRTLMNSMGNLTLSHRRCNQQKGNKTPEEAFASDPDDYDYRAILERAVSCFKEGKYKKFLKGAMEEFNRESGFIDRQLTDNAYLSRKSKEYLSSICPFNKIWTIKGGQTATMRSQWGLNTLLSSSKSNYFKNRSDHRHHSLDALVIALTDRGMIKKMATLNAQGRPDAIKAPTFPFSRQEVETRLKGIRPSIKPDHGKEGKLFQETALGKRQRIGRRSFTAFDDPKEIEWIDSRKLKARFKELIREVGFPKAKKIMAAEWAEENDSEGPFCRIPTWVTRKSLITLKKKEIARIWDTDLKRRIYNSIDVDNLNDKQLEQSLTRFSEESGIKRVRFMPDNTQNASVIKSAPNKAYLPNDYLYVVVWAIPPHKKKKDWEYKGYFVDRVQANDKKFDVNQKKYHPAAKKVATLYKNDIIKIIDDENRAHYARVQGFSTSVNCLDIQALQSSNTMKEWFESTNKMITDNFFSPMKGQNFKSINTLWKKYSIRKISITVDGRERMLNNHAAPDSGNFGGGTVPVF